MKLLRSLLTRVDNFLGFEFLVRNEEIDGHSHEERGIFEESFSSIFTYISYYRESSLSATSLSVVLTLVRFIIDSTII